MKSIILIFILISVTSAQIFDWSGDWTVWDVVPHKKSTTKDKCCTPKSINIIQNLSHADRLYIKLIFDDLSQECPEIENVVHIFQRIRLGRFHDITNSSSLKGISGIFRPNNRTILIDPGLKGNCQWELGNHHSIVTNKSSNFDNNWEGSWEIDFVYPDLPEANCECLPKSPFIIKQDNSRDMIDYTLTFDNQKCDQELLGTHTYRESNVGGAVTDKYGIGFLLPNGTQLIESYKTGCVWGLSKVEDESNYHESSIIM